MRRLAFLLHVLALYPLNGQNRTGDLCINADPLCALSTFSYASNNNFVSGEVGPDYGCLQTVLNPSWFYFQIEEAGDLTLLIEQGSVPGGVPDVDVDFIVYGPFDEALSACVDDLTDSKIIDCSFKPDVFEIATINGVQSGEYYILLITNFSFQEGHITVTQSGAATTNCIFADSVIESDVEACIGDSIILNAANSEAVNYKWYEYSDVNGKFVSIMGETTQNHSVTETNIYRAEALDNNNVVLKIYEFNAVFHQTPNIPNVVSSYIVCGNDEIFDLNLKDDDILNGLGASEYMISYHESLDDAHAGVDPLPLSYTTENLEESIYFRVENANECYEVGMFDLKVILPPEFDLEPQYILCVSSENASVVLEPLYIDTGLDQELYNFRWYLNGEIISNNDASLMVLNEGEYSVIATNVEKTGCEIEEFTEVILSSPPNVVAEVSSLAFVESNTIEVTAYGAGTDNYIYQIDGGEWQENNIFRDVPIGEHTILVKDVLGCGERSISIMVLDYPRFFTPNGDGHNDTWRIKGLKNQPEAKIYIFDRYGSC